MCWGNCTDMLIIGYFTIWFTIEPMSLRRQMEGALYVDFVSFSFQDGSTDYEICNVQSIYSFQKKLTTTLNIYIIILTMASSKKKMRTSRVALIMYYLSAASLLPANNFCWIFLFSFLLLLVLKGLAVGLCVMCREFLGDSGFLSARHCERNTPPTASHSRGTFFLFFRPL